MFSPHKFILNNQTLWLSPERCIYWEEQQALILSDLHFGKTGHFRKSGIGVPQNIFKEDLQRLFSQIQYFHPEKILIVGDLFHSHANKEMELFLKWRKDLKDITVGLIKGNHDILTKQFYSRAKINVTADKLLIDRFCFMHDIKKTCSDDNKEEGIFTFSGHIHPGIQISGLGKQSLYFPCFYFNSAYAILPAFSHFTGIAKIKPSIGDNVFALIENKVLKIQ